MKRPLLFLLILNSFIMHGATIVPFYKETEHFKMFCQDGDAAAADDIATEGEIFFKQLLHDFKHTYRNEKIRFYIYPDLQTFHDAIDNPTAPNWVVARYGDNTINIVSPNNPGPAHPRENIKKSSKNGLTALCIDDKYEHTPRWLKQGVTLYKTDYYSRKHLANLLAGKADLPSLATLEKTSDAEFNNDSAFRNLNGFAISFSIVKFIDQKWGWETILAVLDNYSNFETFVGMNKEDFKEQWIAFIEQECSATPKV